MTGIFDFVRDIISISADLGFVDVVEDVLKETLTRNTSKNFKTWFERTAWGCEVVPVKEIYMNFDIDDLEHLFSDFHDIDHAHHHRVWSDTAYSILYQFSLLFDGMGLSDYRMNGFVFETNFRTLRKHVPSIKEYMDRFYKPSTAGVYRLKEK